MIKRLIVLDKRLNGSLSVKLAERGIDGDDFAKSVIYRYFISNGIFTIVD